MKQSFALAALVGYAMASPLGGIGGNGGDADFIQFLGSNNKGYTSTREYQTRKGIYQKNDDIIN